MLNAISRVLGTSQLRLVTMPRAVAAVPVRAFSRSAWVRLPAAAAKSKKVSAAPGSRKATPTKSAKRTMAKPKNKTKAVATPRKKVAKAKKPAKKAVKPKKSTVKTKTPTQQLRADIRTLKIMALYYGPKNENSPKTLPDNKLAIFVTQNYPKGTDKPQDKLRQLTADFRNLSAPEVERLQAQAKINLARNQQARKDWILTHPPEAIYLANLARNRFARKIKPKRVPMLHDDRLPKKSRSPFALFVKPRFSTLVSAEESNTQALKTLAKEWNALSAAEKKPFEDMSAAESRKTLPLRQELRRKAKAYWEKHYKSLGQAVRVTFPRL